MDEQELAAIQARADAATPGPWVDDVTADGSLVVQGPLMYIAYIGDMEETGKEDHVNAAFIAHARTDIPALLTTLVALVAERDRARAELAAVCTAAIAYDAAIQGVAEQGYAFVTNTRLDELYETWVRLAYAGAGREPGPVWDAKPAGTA